MPLRDWLNRAWNCVVGKMTDNRTCSAYVTKDKLVDLDVDFGEPDVDFVALDILAAAAKEEEEQEPEIEDDEDDEDDDHLSRNVMIIGILAATKMLAADLADYLEFNDAGHSQEGLRERCEILIGEIEKVEAI